MRLDGKNVLVTGAAGFIGSHLTDKLTEIPIGNLVVLDNMYLGKRENLNKARTKCANLIEYLDPKFSTSNFDVMDKILSDENIDIVFDLATIPLPASLEKPKWCFEEITAMAVNLAELCRRGKFETLIHCSTSEVYGTAHYAPMDEAHPWDAELHMLLPREQRIYVSDPT